MLDKTCNTCGKTFPATTEFFHAAKSNKGGLRHKCKECVKIYGHERHIKIQAAKPPEQKKKYLDVTALSKICPGCNIDKDKETGFCKNKGSADGYQSRCRECSNASTKRWRETENGKAKIRANGLEWRTDNPDKVREGKRLYRERHPEKARQQVRNAWNKNHDRYKVTGWRRWIQTKYGLTEDQYYDLLEEQNFGCAICGTSELDAQRKRFCVDHCHDTGVVRGLLCFSCNVVLGNVSDRIDLLEEMIEYLKKFPKPTFFPSLVV